MKTPKKIKLLLKYLRSQLPSCYSVLSHFSRIQFFVTPWTVDHRAPLAMGFSRQEYWSGLPCPPPGDLPYPGMEPPSLMSPPLAGGFFTISTTWEEPCRGSLILHFSALLPLGTLAGSHGDITTAINMAMILPTSAFPYPDFRMK